MAWCVCVCVCVYVFSGIYAHGPVDYVRVWSILDDPILILSQRQKDQHIEALRPSGKDTL